MKEKIRARDDQNMDMLWTLLEASNQLSSGPDIDFFCFVFGVSLLARHITSPRPPTYGSPRADCDARSYPQSRNNCGDLHRSAPNPSNKTTIKLGYSAS